MSHCIVNINVQIVGKGFLLQFIVKTTVLQKFLSSRLPYCDIYQKMGNDVSKDKFSF